MWLVLKIGLHGKLLPLLLLLEANAYERSASRAAKDNKELKQKQTTICSPTPTHAKKETNTEWTAPQKCHA